MALVSCTSSRSGRAPAPDPTPPAKCWYEESPEAVPDVLVYGATASGVLAGVEASRNGMRVTLLEPGAHVGGMTTGGLGKTDIGIAESVGGLARRVYERVGAEYGIDGPQYDFEPHVAERVLRRMLQDACVRLVPGARVSSADRSGTTITSVTTDAGAVYGATVFVDASYEGDLLARAQVPYTVGREANATYGETHNGSGGDGRDTPFNISPYVVPGVTSSGLLPNVIPRPPVIHVGAADDDVEAYNYRLCVTRNPDRRLPFPQPQDYNPADYEALARWFDGMQARGTAVTFGDVVSLGVLPGEKLDLNNKGFFSTDFVGGSRSYPDADYATRDAIAARHKEYILGFLWFLGTSARVPSSVRDEVNSYGLCADEFTDSGGWPHQLYVREARRMIGAYVMTEHDVFRATSVPDPVALGSYALDSHYTRRMATLEAVVGEGLDYTPLPSPYPISFRSLVPARTDADNLLVSVCVSASHAAWKSLRMEPVYMELGHAAGAAAALSVRGKTAVQDVPYGDLAALLRSEGQILSWP